MILPVWSGRVNLMIRKTHRHSLLGVGHDNSIARTHFDGDRYILYLRSAFIPPALGTVLAPAPHRCFRTYYSHASCCWLCVVLAWFIETPRGASSSSHFICIRLNWPGLLAWWLTGHAQIAAKYKSELTFVTLRCSRQNYVQCQGIGICNEKYRHKSPVFLCELGLNDGLDLGWQTTTLR